VPQKNAPPTKDQARVLEKNGLKALLWVVVKELPGSMIVKHRITGEFKVISK
jgi:hypothetical protein